jgi:uncharacterized protein YidB (DUF937 family)
MDGMSQGFPSMTALLGLLAVAGYQNRDKISEMLSGAKQGASGTSAQGGIGGMLSQLGSSLGGRGAGGFLSGGLGQLVDQFKQNGHAETVNSWIGTGPNKQISPSELESAVGPEVMATLATHTGLSRQEILERLSRELPNAVDKYTPEGQLPQA